MEKFDYNWPSFTYATWWISARPSPAPWPTRPAPSASCIHGRGDQQAGPHSTRAAADLGREPTPEHKEMDITWRRCWKSNTPASRSGPDHRRRGRQLGDSYRRQRGGTSTRCPSLKLQDQLQSVLGHASEREAGRGAVVAASALPTASRAPLTRSAAHGVTRERIRQIESKTMSKLRHPMLTVLRDISGLRARRGDNVAAPPAAPWSRPPFESAVGYLGTHRATWRWPERPARRYRRSDALRRIDCARQYGATWPTVRTRI